MIADFQDRVYLKITGSQLKEWLLQFGRSSSTRSYSSSSSSSSMSLVPNIITCLKDISDLNFAGGTLNRVEKGRYLASLSEIQLDSTHSQSVAGGHNSDAHTNSRKKKEGRRSRDR